LIESNKKQKQKQKQKQKKKKKKNQKKKKKKQKQKKKKKQQQKQKKKKQKQEQKKKKNKHDGRKSNDGADLYCLRLLFAPEVGCFAQRKFAFLALWAPRCLPGRFEGRRPPWSLEVALRPPWNFWPSHLVNPKPQASVVGGFLGWQITSFLGGKSSNQIGSSSAPENYWRVI
jgi:hypothetical protein